MTRGDAERLRDVLEAAGRIRRHRSRAGVVPKDLLLDAVKYQLVVIGEAVKGVGTTTRSQQPEVSWQKIAGLRDLLAHEYFRIDSRRIDSIVDLELSDLERAARQLLSGHPSG